MLYTFIECQLFLELNQVKMTEDTKYNNLKLTYVLYYFPRYQPSMYARMQVHSIIIVIIY